MMIFHPSAWTTDPTQRTMLAFSPIPTMEVRLPAGDGNRSLTQLIVLVRDQLDCGREVNVSAVTVTFDSSAIDSLLGNQSGNNSIVGLLSSANQNTVGQLINSFAQRMNQVNNELVSKVSSSTANRIRFSASLRSFQATSH